MNETQSELHGAFRAPRNRFSEEANSIHNDAVASSLGFKGGTIPGSVHMDQFAPLLLKVYGEDWFVRGDISLYFTQATVDNEQVRCVVEPGDQRARLRMYNQQDELICKGTASLNAPDAGSELAGRLEAQEPATPGRLRILSEIKVGDEHRDLPVKVTREVLESTLAHITEDLPIYREKGVLPPSLVVHMAHMTRTSAMEKLKPSVGLFGALEVRQTAGPLRADVDYLARTHILKLTESPRTENVWYDVTFEDAATRKDVGAMLYCLRFMKGSSPLWTGQAAP